MRVTETLFSGRSDYGEIKVLSTPFFGKILVIDGIIQISARTEFVYHEMMVTLPCVRHGAPRSILILGGGDGGAVKHALRIGTVERVVVVEIDPLVLDVCARHLPEVGDGCFDDPRVELTVGDGRRFVQDCRETFDVISLDLTDPTAGGPSEGLVSAAFLREAAALLSPDGVVMTHCGSIIFQSAKTRSVGEHVRSVFPHATLHLALVPEFELTEFGFLACAMRPEPPAGEVAERFRRLVTTPTRHLTPNTYAASRVLSPYLTELAGFSNAPA